LLIATWCRDAEGFDGARRSARPSINSFDSTPRKRRADDHVATIGVSAESYTLQGRNARGRAHS
jgi:hypothetical protein